jgi:hypothetical protein
VAGPEDMVSLITQLVDSPGMQASVKAGEGDEGKMAVKMQLITNLDRQKVSASDAAGMSSSFLTP